MNEEHFDLTREEPPSGPLIVFQTEIHTTVTPSDSTPSDTALDTIEISDNTSPVRQESPQPIPLEELQDRTPSGDDNGVGGLFEFRTKDYDPSMHRELMRGALAISLVAILGLMIFMSFLMIWPAQRATVSQAGVSQQIASQQSIDQPFMVQNQQGAPQETAPVPTPASESPLQELLMLVFTPIIGLVGAVTGFYYGGESARARAGA